MKKKAKTTNRWRWVLADETMFLDAGDKRRKRFAKYKEKHGFSPDELWNLDITIASFVLPRLVEFRKYCTDDIAESVDAMVTAFSLLLDDEYPWFDKEKQQAIDHGLDEFRNSFQSLWT